jgi:DNA-binding XRE family transcriptional regulator
LPPNDRPNKTAPRITVRFRPGSVRQLRAERKLTQLDLSANADLGEATVGRIERGENVSLETARALCAYFNVEIESIADVSTDTDGFVFEAKPRDMSYLFDDMMKELSDIIGKENAKNAMGELFLRMRRFPFGKDKRDALYKRDRYDLDAFITILEFRAGSILSTLNHISTGWIKLRDSEDSKGIMPLESAKAQADEWKERFTNLHESHIQAIRGGNLLMAHEIRQEISDLLTTIWWSYQDFRFPRGIYSSH